MYTQHARDIPVFEGRVLPTLHARVLIEFVLGLLEAVVDSVEHRVDV